MKKLLRRSLLIVALALIYDLVLLWAMPALADGQETIVTIELIPTPSPTPMPPPSETPLPSGTPEPTECPEPPHYDYSAEDARCLSRGIWSVCPANPTRNTKLAFCELVQNREDDVSGDFDDGIRWILLQGNEFPSYDPDAYRSTENNEIADYAMRSWICASVTGNRSFRLVPVDGLYCDFYRVKGRDYIIIYNRALDVVYDSGKGGAQ